MKPSPLPAIDVHGHYGLSTDQKCARTNRFMSGGPAEVVRRAGTAGVAVTIVSPLAGLMIASHDDVERANRAAARAVARHPALRQWVILDPLNPRTFDQARDLLANPRCAGIKIHPEQHKYPIRKHGRALFEFAERLGAVICAHSGQERSLPGDFVPLADAFPGARLILAHLGFGHDEDVAHQVRAIARSRHGNIYADTSSGRSIFPNLIEWAVRHVGADRLLFGSDTPLYHTAMMRARIDFADIAPRDKTLILRGNALCLFGGKIGGG
jgi:predicted TIM-barrel fold metal-dependent hydrolase